MLDLGAGLAGPARLLAHDLGAEVVAVDLAAEYCEIAEWLNEATGLSDRITVIGADALDLPFGEVSFDVVWSQHAQMNVADKQRLYSEARRVLKDGGRLALWDALAEPVEPIHYPVPWADTPELSFLATGDEMLANAARRFRIRGGGLERSQRAGGGVPPQRRLQRGGPTRSPGRRARPTRQGGEPPQEPRG